MLGKRQAAGVCRAVIARARRAGRGTSEFRLENERGSAYLLMWMLGLPLGIILASAAGVGR